MAIVTLEVTTGDYDAHESAAGAVTVNGANINLTAGGQWAGVGFLSAPSDIVGATINSTKLRLYVVNTTGDDPVLDAYLEATSSPAAFNAADTGNISERTRTTSKASVNSSSVGAGWYEITGLAAALTELMMVTDWPAARHVFVILDPLPGCNLNFRTYDHDPALAAELVIDYTPAGSGAAGSVLDSRIFGSIVR